MHGFHKGKKLKQNTGETGVEVISMEEACLVLSDTWFCSPLLLPGSECPPLNLPCMRIYWCPDPIA